LTSDPRGALARQDPAAHTRTYARRAAADLPFDVTAVGASDQVMLDTTVYIDGAQGKLPAPIMALVASRAIVHSAVSACEIATPIGQLNPHDPRTATTAPPLRALIDAMPPTRIVSPSPDAWIEAGTIAGICARTQNYTTEQRRKLLNDALIFLSAIESQAVLVSGNLSDMDLLLQFRPAARVLLYRKRP
jgi:hypothetical protein